MQTEKVSLSAVEQTLLITLYCKALESRLPDSLLKDHLADEIVGRLDHDFSRIDLGRDGAISMALRAKAFDDWTRAFLARHPAAIVLNLGCGLDSRVFRVDPRPEVLWLDVDLPGVIALRRRLFPARAGDYRMMATSVTAPGWLDEVPRDRPAMVVAEGLMPYLPADEAPKLVAGLVAHLPSGELAFDGYGQLGLTMLRHTPQLRATGAEVHWALEDPKSLEAVAPGLRYIGDKVSYDPAGVPRMSWPARLTMRLWRFIPALRKLGRLLRYEWGTA